MRSGDGGGGQIWSINLIHLPGKGLGRFLRWPVSALCRISDQTRVNDRWYHRRWRQYVWSMIVAVYRYPLTWPITNKWNIQWNLKFNYINRFSRESRKSNGAEKLIIRGKTMGRHSQRFVQIDIVTTATDMTFSKWNSLLWNDGD